MKDKVNRAEPTSSVTNPFLCKANSATLKPTTAITNRENNRKMVLFPILSDEKYFIIPMLGFKKEMLMEFMKMSKAEWIDIDVNKE